MKNIFLKTFLILGMTTGVLPVNAEQSTDGLKITDPVLTRNGNLMTVKMGLDFDGLDLKSNQAAVFTPMIVNETDTLKLPSVGVYGRTRWYQYRRSGFSPISGEDETTLRYKKKMEVLNYVNNVNYSDWMNGSELIVRRADYGCAGCGEGEMSITDLATYQKYEYKPVYLAQEVDVEAVLKTRELSGRAFVDFPVNKIVIYPDYRNNTYELNKIIATIDSVKSDKDVTVTSLWIKGTASPEGPYDNNVYLSKNRTIALKDYVRNLYNFPPDFIKTDYDPVDWAGLREWLENNNLEYKNEILSIVNSNIEDFARNSKIKKDYPKQYEWLLRNVYPALRHSDYRIEYNIRQFSDVAEIAEVLKTSPGKLSLNEIYLLAKTMEPGSKDYYDLFETAAILFPDSELANLNAANSAMQNGNLTAAEKYLQKAGNSAKAVYARGLLAGFKGDFKTGEQLIQQAMEMGLADAGVMLQMMRDGQKYGN